MNVVVIDGGDFVHFLENKFVRSVTILYSCHFSYNRYHFRSIIHVIY